MKALKIKNGFTLIELIIVIAILAILSTIAFLSFGGKILPNSRDTTRVTNLQNIYKGLNASHSAGKLLNFPENSTPIKVAGKVIGYQGTLPQTALQAINSSISSTDEFSKRNIIYRINAKRTAVQLMTYLEGPYNSKGSVL